MKKLYEFVDLLNLDNHEVDDDDNGYENSSNEAKDYVTDQKLTSNWEVWKR